MSFSAAALYGSIGPGILLFVTASPASVDMLFFTASAIFALSAVGSSAKGLGPLSSKGFSRFFGVAVGPSPKGFRCLSADLRSASRNGLGPLSSKGFSRFFGLPSAASPNGLASLSTRCPRANGLSLSRGCGSALSKGFSRVG